MNNTDFCSDLKEFIRETNSLAEHLRASKVRSLNIIGSSPEKIYDDVVFVAAQICGTSSAVLTFIDEEKAFVKASVKDMPKIMPRDVSFCNVAIQNPDEVLVVKDAKEDPRFATNPKVLDKEIVFYAGVPLVLDECPLGALCVVDDNARDITEDELSALKRLARVVLFMLSKRVSKSVIVGDEDANSVPRH